MDMRTIIPDDTPVKDMHQYLLGTVAPRPIALVSTIDEEGNPNLAPYSFFNAFSSNPPIVVFSSNRRVADNTTKDTLHNVQATGECVINAVSHDIVRQMAISSIGYDSGISEFEKSGLTPVMSDLVSPFRVKESPAHMECKVKEIVTLGHHGGAGHLVICDVVRMHVAERVLNGDRIDPHKMDLMGRMGRAYYVRASGHAVHTIVQSVVNIAIGYDGLPESARSSKVLTGNDLGYLGGATAMPSEELVTSLKAKTQVVTALESGNPLEDLHTLAKTYIDEDQRDEALALILIADNV